jgi:hypothetical protein
VTRKTKRRCAIVSGTNKRITRLKSHRGLLAAFAVGTAKRASVSAMNEVGDALNAKVAGCVWAALPELTRMHGQAVVLRYVLSMGGLREPA